MIEKFIDYLQVSSLYREQTCIEKEHKQINPIKFYPRGYEDELGVRRYFGNPNSVKALIIYSGAALHNWRVIGWKIEEAIEKFIANGANITRIDWCTTEYIEDNLITVDDVANDFEQSKFTGTLTKYEAKKIVGIRPDAPNGQKNTTQTFYIGSMERRGTNGIFRAYDKGLEIGGIAAQLITRLELEERGTNAHNSAKRYISGAKLGDVVNSRLQCNSEQWERVIGAESVDISRGDNLVKSDESEAHERRKIWLMKQVLPALADVIRKEPDFANIFSDALHDELDDIL